MIVLPPPGNDTPMVPAAVPAGGRFFTAGRRPGLKARRATQVPEQTAPARAGAGRLRLSTDNLRIALFLLLIVTVSRINQQFGFLVKLRVALLLTLAVAAFAYFNPRLIRREKLLSTWPAKVMAGLGIMACISVPFGISIGGSGRMILEDYSKVLIGAFLLILAVRGVRDLYTLVVAFVAGSGILAVLSLWVFPVSMAGGLMRISSGYSFDANDLGTMAVAGMAIALLLFSVGRGWVRVMALATIAGLVGTMARSGSRGGFLGLLALGVGYLLLVHGVPLWKRASLVVLATGSLFLMAPAGYWNQMETILNPKQDYNWTAPSGRRETWKRGIGYMVERPLTGVGVGNFRRAEGTISQRAKEFQVWMAGIAWSAAHNSFIQAGAEMGFPGLILFSWLVLGGIVAMQLLRGRMPKHWRRGTQEQRFLRELPSYLSLALFAFTVAGSFVSFAYWDLVYILAAFMSAAYFCTAQLVRHQQEAASLSKPR
ncbi:MAG: O-antigen ligase family protein [Gemmatimonadales bacterium]